MSPDAPERISAMPPQALGDDIDVPFISWVPRRVQLGTDAMAPPGALMLTPRAPSVLGPLDDQVYWLGGSFSLREYSATIMSGVTYAPTPREGREQESTWHVKEIIQNILLLFFFRLHSVFEGVELNDKHLVGDLKKPSYHQCLYLWHCWWFPPGSRPWRGMDRCFLHLKQTSHCASARPLWSPHKSSWKTNW